MNETYAQRMRVTFSTADTVKYVGHLDMHRAWERAIRRARLPLAYTQGFNPQARLQFAAALPVGFTGQGEVADVFLNEALDPAEFLSRLAAALPPGIRPLRAEPVARESPVAPIAGLRRALPGGGRDGRTGRDVRGAAGRFSGAYRGVARAAPGQRRGALRPAPAGAGAGLHRGRAPTGRRSPLRCAPSRARRGGPTSCWRSWASRPPRGGSCGRSCCLRGDDAQLDRPFTGWTLVEKRRISPQCPKTRRFTRNQRFGDHFVSWCLCGEDISAGLSG